MYSSQQIYMKVQADPNNWRSG